MNAVSKKLVPIIASLIVAVLFYACQPNLYRVTNKSYKKQAKAYGKIISQKTIKDTLDWATPPKWVGTTNFSLRRPNMVIIHHTAQNNCAQTLQTFTKPSKSVSAHYVICEDGTVHHMLHDYLRAWHAGTGKWGNNSDINSSSIGIEIDNNGTETFTEDQMLSLEKLLTHLKTAYKIPQENVIGHADIAPTRKNDPNVTFDWQRLSNLGFGMWYSDTTDVQMPVDFKPLFALKMIGYDIKDTTAVVRTFKRKFLKSEDGMPLTSSDKKVLYTLWTEAMKH
ncbi:MAG: N-acetylmuramoyl-L-alanine amidase [Algoriphagus sp.]|jgi:N-acetylmuramoyl-L-alanine amidase